MRRRKKDSLRTHLERTFPMDFVVTWVDDSDPAWKKRRDEYAELEKESLAADSNAPAMYQDHGTLRHWSRAVEKYAPWVRKIHFVTEGHVPDWLDTTNPKIQVVRHDEILDAENLPTFNPRAIQSGFLRIPDLADHFIVFDDDTFLNAPVTPEFFFPKGLPFGMALPNALALRSSHSHALLNVAGVLNENFSQRGILRKHWRKWLSPRYGKELYRSFALLPWPYVLPFAISHLPIPILRSAMEEAFEAADKDLQATASRRFRDPKDILPVTLTAGWQCATGRFTPVSRKSIGRTYDLAADPADAMESGLSDPNAPTICFNDSTSASTTQAGKRVLAAFDAKFPSMSQFETNEAAD